jgi:hypothetical protein
MRGSAEACTAQNVGEAPDPNQTSNASLKARLTEVRKTLGGFAEGIFTGKGQIAAVPVKVAGQLFLDAHQIGTGNPGGGRGTEHCATNVWEIHPVTAIEIQSR